MIERDLLSRFRALDNIIFTRIEIIPFSPFILGYLG